MDTIIELLKTNPLVALVVILIGAIGWIVRQWMKSLESERALAVQFATATEAQTRSQDSFTQQLNGFTTELGRVNTHLRIEDR